MPVYLLHAVDVGGTIIPAIAKTDLAAQAELLAEPTSGNVFPEFAHIVSREGKAEFDTKAVGTGLGACALAGLDISVAAVNFYQKQLAAGGGIVAGANHRRLRCSEGLLVPRQLTVSDREDAVLSYEAILSYDDANDLFLVANNIALPGVPADNERYGIGTAIVGGATMLKLRSLTIDFGLEVHVETSGSSIYPQDVYITATMPRMTLQVKDPTMLDAANIPWVGQAMAHANTQVYLRKRTAGGFAPDGNAVHIQFTLAGYCYVSQPFSASGADPGETTIEAVAEYDQVNDPLVINTASVHPAAAN